MTYNQSGRLLTWQDKPSNPTTTESYAYDGEGQRVQMSSATSSGTTTTSYIGDYEEITTSGSTTTTTTYYGKNAVSVNGTISYLIHDGLGSVSLALATSGSVQGAQLFAPYGSVRYTTGSFPTTKAFTGQHSDGSGLSYFNARYYDPIVGQFTSADSVQGNNRYAYVAGNPETATDPSGQFALCGGMPMADGVCWRSIQHQRKGSTGTTAIISTIKITYGTRNDTRFGPPHPGGSKENLTRRHNAVRDDFVNILSLIILLLFGRTDRSLICVECRIPYASKDNPGVQPGYADVILWLNAAHTKGWIWDIKSITVRDDKDAHRDAMYQITNYILWAHRQGVDLLRGPALDPQHKVGVDPGDLPPGYDLWSASANDGSGLIYYWLKLAPPPPPPPTSPSPPCGPNCCITSTPFDDGCEQPCVLCLDPTFPWLFDPGPVSNQRWYV